MNRPQTFESTAWARPFAMLLLAVLALVALASCADDEGESGDAGDEPVQVVVTLPVFTSMAEAVGGEHVQVESIVPAGADAHTYQPTPGDAQLVAEADLVLVNGLGLEEFLDDLIESAGGVDVPVIELAGGMQDEAIEEGAEDAAEDDDDEHGHDHPEGNPHLWLDPEFGIHYVETIAAELASVDADNAANYEANAEEYIGRIAELDQWAQAEFDRIPPEDRVMVTFHDAFPYFAEHYGLEIAGVIVTSPGRDPGAREIAELTGRIRDLDADAIFVEPQFDPALAETVADEAGAELYEIYSGAPPEGIGYLEMMEINVERVVEGLS